MSPTRKSDFAHVKGADRLPDGRQALRSFQKSLGVEISQDHPERHADGPGGPRKRRGKQRR